MLVLKLSLILHGLIYFQNKNIRNNQILIINKLYRLININHIYQIKKKYIEVILNNKIN